MPTDPTAIMQEAVRLWSGIEAPNEAALRGLQDLPGLIADFEAQRGTLVFEDEPSGFELALRDEKEPGA